MFKKLDDIFILFRTITPDFWGFITTDFRGFITPGTLNFWFGEHVRFSHLS